jgi:hypothetical protein
MLYSQNTLLFFAATKQFLTGQHQHLLVASMHHKVKVTSGLAE